MRTGEQVAGLATVDAADEGFLVVEAAEEQQFFAEGLQRLEHLAELHRLAFALGPPLLAVEAVAGEQAGEAHRRLGAGAVVGCSSPQTGSDSSHGSAIVTPTPRRNVRRESG